MVICKLIVAYAIPLLIGMTAVSLAEGRRGLFRKGEKLAIGFALGLGIQTMYIFCLGLLNIRFTFWSCSAPVWPALLVNLFWLKTGRISLRPGPVTLFRDCRAGGKILIGALTLLMAVKLVLNMFISFSSPAYFDDSITIWDYKAKVFYYHRGLVKDPDHPDFFGGNAPKYPNAVPLFKTWITICTGGWREWTANSISTVLYLLTGIVLYYGLRRWFFSWLALIGSYLVMSLPLFAFHGAFVHADNFVGFYLMGGIIFLYRWMLERKTGLILVAAGFFTVAGWIKDEGLILFAGGTLLPLILYLILNRGAWKRGLLLPLTVILFLLPWLVTEIVFQFPLAVATGGFLKLEFHPEAVMIMKRFFFNTGNYNILWLLYMISLFMAFKHGEKDKIAYLVGINILTLFTALGAFIFTPWFKWLTPGTTINRAMLTVIPALIFTVTLIWGIWLKEEETNFNQRQI